MYTLRHSSAGVVISHRVLPEVVPELLGQSSIAITGDVYGHVPPDLSRGAMDVLGAAFGG